MALTDKKVLHSRPYNTRLYSLRGRAPRSIPQKQLEAARRWKEPPIPGASAAW